MIFSRFLKDWVVLDNQFSFTPLVLAKCSFFKVRKIKRLLARDLTGAPYSPSRAP